MITRENSRSAFTLVELMMASSIAVIILGALVLGGANFMHVFNAEYTYYAATSDQERVMDYIARDVRRATSGTVTSGTSLSLNVPIYTSGSNSSGLPDLGTGTPVSPTISSGIVTYGTSSMTVNYFTNTLGNTGAIVRQCVFQNGSNTTILAQPGGGWIISFSDPNDQSHLTKTFLLGGTSSITSVKNTLTFQPEFDGFNRAVSNSVAGAMIETTEHLRSPH